MRFARYRRGFPRDAINVDMNKVSLCGGLVIITPENTYLIAYTGGAQLSDA